MIPLKQITGAALCLALLAGCGMFSTGEQEAGVNTPIMIGNLQGTWLYKDPDTGAVQTLILKTQGLGSLSVDEQTRTLTFHWMIDQGTIYMRYYKDGEKGFEWKIVEDQCGYLLRGNILELKRGSKTLMMRRAAPAAR